MSEQIARQFHGAYERLAPQFGYETREDTKVFDPQSQNGRLMIAVCAEVIGKLERERDQARRELEIQLENIKFHMEQVPVREHPLRADDAPLSGEEHEKSDTPITDAALIERRHIHKRDGSVQLLELVDADLTRKLERERNSLQDQRDLAMSEIELLRKERDGAREALRVLFKDYKELADSGDAGFWELEDKEAAQPALRILQQREAAK